MAIQQGWASCSKCQGLHYAGFPNFKGVCPAGGGHEQAGSWAYGMLYDVPGNAHRQTGWASCSTCQGLHYAGFPNFKGVCPVGGAHEQDGSFAYSMLFDTGEHGGQQEWRSCPKCQGLFYGPFKGRCPATGGEHISEGSFNYFVIGGPDGLPPPRVVVSYKGLQCFAEMTQDQLSNADEPYAVISTIAPTGDHHTISTQIYEDVDSGDSRKDDILLYTGPAYDLVLDVLLREYDFGNPEEFRDEVGKAVDTAAGAITTALVGVPLVGPGLSALFAAAWKKYGGDIADEVNKILDTEDDTIGGATLVFTRERLLELATAPTKEFRGVLSKIETPLISGGGGDYKLAFDVHLA